MQHIESLTALSRRALSSTLARGRETGRHPCAVDATAGNGHDTLFLASEVGENGHVWAFDVQEAALAATRSRIATEGAAFSNRLTLVHAGHETAEQCLPADIRGNLWAVTFNLGFLPGSDRRVKTAAATTLEALHFFAERLAVGGVVSVHAYRGHRGGEEEGAAVGGWFAALPWEIWCVAEYAFCNRDRNPETLFLAEKLG